MTNCTKCYWWTKTQGCSNTNWTCGRLTDPFTPLCEELSFRNIPIKETK